MTIFFERWALFPVFTADILAQSANALVGGAFLEANIRETVVFFYLWIRRVVGRASDCGCGCGPRVPRPRGWPSGSEPRPGHEPGLVVQLEAVVPSQHLSGRRSVGVVAAVYKVAGWVWVVPPADYPLGDLVEAGIKRKTKTCTVSS